MAMKAELDTKTHKGGSSTLSESNGKKHSHSSEPFMETMIMRKCFRHSVVPTCNSTTRMTTASKGIVKKGLRLMVVAFIMVSTPVLAQSEMTPGDVSCRLACCSYLHEVSFTPGYDSQVSLAIIFSTFFKQLSAFFTRFSRSISFHHFRSLAYHCWFHIITICKIRQQNQCI